MTSWSIATPITRPRSGARIFERRFEIGSNTVPSTWFGFTTSPSCARAERIPPSSARTQRERK